MARLHPQVAEAVADGFRATSRTNPHMWSSSLWEGWELGKELARNGSHTLRLMDIEAGRARTWRTNGWRYKLNFAGASGGHYWTREAL